MRRRAGSASVPSKNLLTGRLGDGIDQALARVRGRVCRYYFHSGMYKAAEAILDRVADTLIAWSFRKAGGPAGPKDARGYRLVITGHSLGAGVASILAFLIRKRRVWATDRMLAVCLGPAASGSLNFARESRDYLYQFLFDYDIVPRASLHSMAVLASRLKALADGPATARSFDPFCESRRLHRPHDLYVGGNVFCVQPERKGHRPASRPAGSRRAARDSAGGHESESEQAEGIWDPEGGAAGRWPYRVSLLDVHDLGELILGEAALYDHGFYTHPFHILQKHEQSTKVIS